MKKRRLVWGMIAVLLVFTVALTGCEATEPLTAYTLVADAVAKTEALDSVDKTLSWDMVVETNGAAETMYRAYNIKGQGLRSETPVMSVKMEVPTNGDVFSSERYYENGYCYYSVLGLKMKYKSDLEKGAAVGDLPYGYEGVPMAERLMINLPAAVLKDAEIVKNDDDIRTVKIALDETRFKEMYGALADAVVSHIAGDLSAVFGMKFSDIAVEIVVGKDGYIADYRIGFVAAYTMELLGEKVAMNQTVNLSLAYHDPGRTVTVTVPEGYLDFPESDIGR